MIFCRKLDVACRCESAPYIPRHDVDRVRALATHRADMECHVQEDAGQDFDTHGFTMFYRPAAAR